MNQKYHVIDTPMRPNRWKVESLAWPGANNSTSEYFPRYDEAQAESTRRNLRLEQERKAKDARE